MDDVVFVMRLHDSASGCHYLQAIFQGDDDQSPVFYLDLSFMGTSSNYVEVSNCGGVFCFNAFKGRIVLCNPVAKSLKFLPPTRPPPPSSYINFRNSGFGYDSISDDYKVVRIFDIVNYETNDEGRKEYCSSITKSELFSFKSNSWKEIESDVLDDVMLCRLSGYALVGCSYHWLVYACAIESNCILAFDFSEEIFSLISLPWSYCRSISLCQVVSTQNNLLGVILYSRHGEWKTFEVWEYGIDGEWSRLYEDATLNNVDKPVKLNGSLMYVLRETTRGVRQLLVYDWVGRVLKELDIYDFKDVLEMTSITSSPTPKLRKSVPIDRFQSEAGWDVYWSNLQQIGMSIGVTW